MLVFAFYFVKRNHGPWKNKERRRFASRRRFGFWLRDCLLANRRIGSGCRSGLVDMDGVRICRDEVEVSAGRAYTVWNLWIRVNSVAGLRRGGFGKRLHGVDISVDNRRRAIETGVEQVLLSHLFKRAERAALVGVEVKHLLFGDCA